MSMLDAAREAAAGRLGGSTRWRDAMMPEMPDFGAMPDLSAMPTPAPQPAQPSQADAEREEYAGLLKKRIVDENGMAKDGKMYRGPKARTFAAQNGGWDYVLKDKDLAKQLNQITIDENRAMGGFDPLPKEPVEQANSGLNQAIPKPENMPVEQYNQLMGVISQGKNASPDLTKYALEKLAPGSTNAGQKQIEREEKRRKAMEAQKKSIEDATDTANSALATIAKLRKNLNDGILPESGLWSTPFAYIPETDAYNLRKHLDTLKGIIGLQSLIQAKAGSQNGASGFGALSEKELALLQNKLGALDAGMGKKELLESLGEIEPLFQRSLLRREIFDEDLDAMPSAGASAATPPLPPGFVLNN